MAPLRAPPHRIETERLVIRCWQPGDAPLLKEAADSSLDHLRPWMPWAANEPQTVEEKRELLRVFKRRFERGEDFTYGIFSADETEVVGGTGLHTRPMGPAYELGYWIRVSRLRRGLVTECCRALARVGFDLCGAEELVIRIEPKNTASLGVPVKLGYTPDGRQRSPGGRDLLVFRLPRAAYEAQGGGAAAPARAYDAAGARLL